jgi:drug/metabolite transporter (DMT)-like permease
MFIVVAFALGAAAVYGASDFFGAFAAKRINVVTSTMVNYAVATVASVIPLLIIGGVWSSGAAWSGIVAGLLAVVGLLAFYAALAIGPMSLLSPLIALIESIVPVTISVVTGQPLNVIGWIAIGVAVAALLLMSPPPRPGRDRITAQGAVLAAISGLFLGGSLIALDAAPHDSGVVPAFWEIAVGLGVLVVAWALMRGIPLRGSALEFVEPHPATKETITARRAWIATAASGLLTAAADSFIVLALHLGSLAVVSVLVALYPVVTVILAASVLRERMTRLQVVAVALVIVASVMFSAS